MSIRLLKTLADTVDTVSMDVPLLTRIMELCLEDIKDDAQLHFVLEAIIRESKSGTLTMDSYQRIIKGMP